MKNSLHLLSLLVLLLLPQTAFSDSLVSTTGDSLNGELVSFNRDSCTFAPTLTTGQMEIAWSNIKSLKSDSQFTVDLDGGDRITGKISYTPKGGIIISSARSKANISLSHLQQVRPWPPEANAEPANSNQTELETPRPPQSEPPEAAKPDRKLKPIGQNETTFGQQQEEPPLTFLRGSTVLLSPGQVESRVAVTYQPIKQESIYGGTQYRIYSAILSANIGVTERLEVYVNVPFSHVQANQSSLFGDGRHKRTGFGDVNVSINALLKPESVYWPEFSLSASVTAPTGSKPYSDNKAYTGSGHWVADLGLNFVRSVEPAILFGGLSGGYIFPYKTQGLKYEYGWEANYHLGLGFAINDRLSVSSVFRGGYRPALAIDGDSFGQFSSDPFYLSMGLAYRLDHRTVLEPSIRFGLNDDAGDPAFSLGISRKFN